MGHLGTLNLNSSNHLSHRIQDPGAVDNGKLRSNQCEPKAKEKNLPVPPLARAGEDFSNDRNCSSGNLVKWDLQINFNLML